MVIMIGDTSGLAEGIRGAGSALAQGLAQRRQRQKEQALREQNLRLIAQQYPDLLPGISFSPQIDENRNVNSLLSVLDNQQSNVDNIQADRLIPNDEKQSFSNEKYNAGLLMQIIGNNTNDKFMTAMGNNITKAEEFNLKTEIEERRAKESNRDFHSKKSDKFLDEIEKLRPALIHRKQARNQMRKAIESGNIGPYSKAFFSELFGDAGRGFMTPEGGLLNTAEKELLLGDISSLTGRPNQWIEQTIKKAYPQVGQSMKTQKVMEASLHAREMIDEARVQISDNIEESDMNSFGYVTRDIGKRHSKELNKVAKEIEENLGIELRLIDESDKDVITLMKDADQKVIAGTPLTPKNAQAIKKRFNFKNPAQVAAKAEALGYTIYSLDKIKEAEDAFK